MDRIVRREFVGSWVFVTALCATVYGIPIAIIHLINNAIEMHTEISDSEEFISLLKTRKYKK